MGTRNLTCVFEDGAYRVAQYGQWDGYPSGAGATVLKFCQEHLRNLAGRDAFKAQCRSLVEVTNEQLKEWYREAGHNSDSKWVDWDVSKKFAAAHPHLHRDCGAGILELIRQDKVREINNEIDFAADSLFCEWAYVIDLTANTLEVYGGFNKVPLDPAERFAHMGPTPETVAAFKPRYAGEELYYPIRKLGGWSLDALPTQEEFESALEEKEQAA